MCQGYFLIKNIKTKKKYKIKTWMNDLAQTYPDLVQVYKIGKTFQKRPIMVMKVINFGKIKTPKPKLTSLATTNFRLPNR